MSGNEDGNGLLCAPPSSSGGGGSGGAGERPESGGTKIAMKLLDTLAEAVPRIERAGAESVSLVRAAAEADAERSRAMREDLSAVRDEVRHTGARTTAELEQLRAEISRPIQSQALAIARLVEISEAREAREQTAAARLDQAEDLKLERERLEIGALKLRNEDLAALRRRLIWAIGAILTAAVTAVSIWLGVR